MKIILETSSNACHHQVYVQKRDLLYLEKTNRTEYLELKNSKSSLSLESAQDLSSFVRFDGEDAVRYFKEQKDILDYQDYLHMPLSTFETYENRQADGNNYFDQTMLELLLEKEGMLSLPYPIFETTKRCLKKYQLNDETYSLYSSSIPKLYYIKKEGNSSYLTRRTIPESFLEECEAKACVDTFEEEYMPVPSKTEDVLLLMPKVKELVEEKKEQQTMGHIKRFIKSITRKQGK